MAYTPSTIADLKEFLAEGDPREIADFLSVHKRAAQAFLGLGEKDTDKFVRYMRGGDETQLKRACGRLDDCLQMRGALLDDFLPRTNRRSAEKRETIKQERNTHLLMAAHSAGRSLSNIFKGKAYEAFQDSVRVTTELNVALWSQLGFGLISRHFAQAGLGLPAIAVMANVAATNITGEAQAAVPPKAEPVHNAQTLTETFRQPLELTITPRQGNPFDVILQGDYKMMPSLVRHMERDPQAKEYVEWCLNAAKKSGIDGNLFANQMYKESFWFKPEVIDGRQKSPTGATGIAQFMPGTAKALGVDPLNPKEAIFAAAAFMGKLTRQYDDQHLAMIVYNGRDDALDFVQAELGLEKTPSIKQWMGFMRERRETLGTQARHAWHVETLGYVEQISSNYWDKGVQRAAIIGKTNTAALNLPDIKIIPLPFSAPRNL